MQPKCEWCIVISPIFPDPLYSPLIVVQMMGRFMGQT